MNLRSPTVFANIITIINVLQYKFINNVIIFNCHNEFETVNVQKIFADNGIKSQSFNIGVDMNYATTYSKVGVILNTGCNNWTIVFKNINIKSFKNPYVWLMIGDDIFKTSKQLSQYPIEVDSDVIIIEPKENETNVKLFEIFNTGFNNNGKFIMQHIEPSRINKTSNFVDRRDLSGVVIRSTIVVTEDLNNKTVEEFMSESVDNEVDAVHKVKFYLILKHIQDMYSFTLKFNLTQSWGYLYNGTFDGMVGDLINGQADIGGSSIFFRMDRAELIDYVVETWPSRFSFIFRHPKHTTGFYTIYSRPLANSVWYCILASIILTGFSMFVILKVSIRNQPAEESSISLAFLFSIASLCQQGMPMSRNSAAVKILVFITLAYSVIIYQYYNALIVATLLREPPTTIRTLQDLLHSNLKTGIDDVLYNKDYLQRTTDPVAIELYRKKVIFSNHYNFFDPEQGMALVKQGGFAFHVDNNVAYAIMQTTFTEREICETRDVLMFPPQRMAAVVAKDSPYKEHIAYGVRKMFESGLMRRLKLLLDAPKPKCTHTPDSSIFSVNISEFSCPLIAIMFGIIISILTLFCEILLNKITHY